MNPKSLVHPAQFSNDTRPSILAVEDDEDNLFLITCVLEQLGYPYRATTSGQQALSIVKTCSLELILLDVVLPDSDGTAILKQLRRNKRTADIPIIAVTGLALPEDRPRLLQLGFNDYISKPYLLEDLEALITSYLTQKIFQSLA